MFTVYSTVTDETAQVEHVADIPDAIRPWYPEAPEDVTDAIDDLESKLRRGEYLDGVDVYLAIRIKYA